MTGCPHCSAWRDLFMKAHRQRGDAVRDAAKAHETLAQINRDTSMLAIWRALALSALIVILVLGVVLSSQASAEPQNFRHGYPSCSSCHISPSGGGVLNNYGRSVANSALTTWRTIRPDLPEWIAAGYSGRRGYVNVNSEFGDLYQTVDMHAEAEFAFEPVPGLWVGGTAGVYGNEHVPEYRRTYAQLNLLDVVTLRTGRFLQAAGIQTPDHTEWARRGWGLYQGREVFAAELAVLTQWGELIASQAAGPSVQVGAGVKGMDVIGEPETTFARASAYLPWWRSQLGASARWTDGRLDAWGVHAMAAPISWAWAMGEAVIIEEKNSNKWDMTTSAKLSVEPIQGVQLFGTHESQSSPEQDPSHRIGAGAQLFPFYGLDLTGRWARTLGPVRTDEWTAVVHVYL